MATNTSLSHKDAAVKNWLLTLLKQHALIAYFILAYAFSWAVELPLAATAQGWLHLPLPLSLHYLASFGPALAALLMVAATEGRQGVRQLLGRVVQWRVGLGWMLFAILAPIGLFGAAALVGAAATQRGPNIALLGEVDYLPAIGVGGALVLWLVTFGLGEEIGWRGYALPHLQKRHSALTATLIIGVLWALWHIPAFFYKDTYVAMGLVAGLPLLLLSIIAASVVFTWLYNGSGGSLLVVIIFHALFDLLSVSRAGGESVAAVMSAGVMIWAVVLVLYFKPARLSPDAKQVR